MISQEMLSYNHVIVDINAFQYEDGEEVVLWMNTVGPYHNRQETYSYFSLPFCAGPKEGIGHYHETLSEAIQGVELESSGIDIDFKGKHLFFSVHFSQPQLFLYSSLSLLVQMFAGLVRDKGCTITQISWFLWYH